MFLHRYEDRGDDLELTACKDDEDAFRVFQANRVGTQMKSFCRAAEKQG